MGVRSRFQVMQNLREGENQGIEICKIIKKKFLGKEGGLNWGILILRGPKITTSHEALVRVQGTPPFVQVMSSQHNPEFVTYDDVMMCHN